MRKIHVAICLLTLLPAAASNVRAEWYADVQFLLLSPSIPSQGFDDIFYEGAPIALENEGSLASGLQYATRLQLGYEDCSGFGGRVRWFTLDNDIGYSGVWDVGGTPLILQGTTNLDVDAVDLDVTQRGRFACWNLLGSAGLRYGRLALRENDINFEDAPAFIFAGQTGVEFEGVGPTLALEGRRNVASTGVSLFASGRTSLLLGDVDNYSAFRIGGLHRVRDEMVQVWELQLGIEHSHQFRGASLDTGIFWETQRWDSEHNTLGDLGLMGFGLHTGLTY